MRTKLTETDITRIVKKVINEDLSKDKMIEILDDVANRLREHGIKYYRELNKLNYEYPTEKYKRPEPPKRKDFELPKGIKVSKSTFPDEL